MLRVVIGVEATAHSVPTGIHQELCENRIMKNKKRRLRIARTKCLELEYDS